MISVLLVEDDKLKAENVTSALSNLLPLGALSIVCVGNLHDAAIALEKHTVDLLILDIQVPLRSGDMPKLDGGVEFLEQLYTSRRYRRPSIIVGLSAFEETVSKHQGVFSQRMWHLIRYDSASREWSQRLGSLLLHVADAKTTVDPGYDFDIAIITALEEVELDSVRALPADWSVTSVTGDDTIYHSGTFSRGDKKLRVVTAASLEMGMPAATALSMKLIAQFKPKYLAMVGIAAGVKGRFGDILVADIAWDYGSGKTKAGAAASERFLPDPHPIPLDPLLKAKLSLFRGETELLEKIRKRWAGGGVEERIQVQIGPVASGASVVEDRTVVNEIQSHARKLAGLEMETYGVFLAGRMCKRPKPLVMSVKSICDFADADKADTHQRYAAYTSASFLYEFALAML